MNEVNRYEINLKQEIFSGTFWSGGGQVLSTIIRFCSFLVLARLLPASFIGLLGLSAVIIPIFRDLSYIGVNAALVQKDKIDDIDLSTTFWFAGIVGLLLSPIVFFGSEFLATLLGNLRFELLLKMIAVLIPINAFSMIPQSLLTRKLKFAQLSLRDVAGEIGFAVIGITFAILNMGIWSLVGALSAQWVCRAAVMWIYEPYIPVFRFEIERLKRLFRFSFWMFVNSFWGRLMENVDYLLISRFLGATALGYYTLAFQLVILPVQRAAAILSRVLFPSLSKIQHQIDRLKHSFLKIVKMLILVLFPVSALFILEAHNIVPLLYSEKWIPAVPVVRILGLASFFYVLIIMDSMLQAIGKPDLWFVVIFIKGMSIIILAYLWGLEKGVTGMAFCIAGAAAITFIIQIYILLKKLKISLIEFMQTLYIPSLAIILSSLLIWMLTDFTSAWPRLINVVVITLVFAILYGSMIFPWYSREFRHIVLLVKSAAQK